MHIGSGKWIVIDSCRPRGQSNPAALIYLEALGVEPENAIVAVIVTHWHDDHVRGISKILERCPTADFVAASVMSATEFITMIEQRKEIRRTEVSSGVDELFAVYENLEKIKRRAVRATAERRILFQTTLAHGHDCSVYSLSPSDKQFEIFMNDLASLMPDLTKTESRCMPRSPNNLSVVTWFEIGPINLLLGADLEETAATDNGWSAIISSSTKPQGTAKIFKIPHHGSENGHHDDVWSRMLSKEPIAALSPYSRSNLPRPSDVERINALTPNAYNSSDRQLAKANTRFNAAVVKTLREAGIVVRASQPTPGQVQIRNKGRESFDAWDVKLIGAAAHL